MRFNSKIVPLMTWRELFTEIRLKLFGGITKTEIEEVEETYPCGCKNPRYDWAEYEQITITGKHPFTITPPCCMQQDCKEDCAD